MKEDINKKYNVIMNKEKDNCTNNIKSSKSISSS